MAQKLLGDEGAIRVTTAFHRIIRGCAEQVNADVVFLDVGPNLGAINRAALLASDDLVVPLAADLFSLQGLRNLGPTLRGWREAWQGLVLPKVPIAVDAPAGTMEPIGYIVLQHAVRLDRLVKAYDVGCAASPRSSTARCSARTPPESPVRPTHTSSQASATTAA